MTTNTAIEMDTDGHPLFVCSGCDTGVPEGRGLCDACSDVEEHHYCTNAPDGWLDAWCDASGTWHYRMPVAK